MTRPLAVLRPEPGNAATARRIEALGLQAVRLPLFEVRALPWSPPPGDFDALMLTSANAVRFGGAGLAALRHLPVLAVGAETAGAARCAGFDVMAAGETDAAALVALARERGIARALYLGGRERSIAAGGPVAQAIPVYASDALAIAPRRLRDLDGAIALLHSARAATRIGDLFATHGMPRSSLTLAAFSLGVAAAAGPGWASVAVAAAPNDAALIAAARARD